MRRDPDERRDTPLARKLRERIGREGAIPVSAYVYACLYDPEHGYYRVRQAVGAQGDFVTAPEISQVFGELIGLWCAVVWWEMGEPQTVRLIELGPGRGTLIADALRATRHVAGFHRSLDVHLVERSETLHALQRAALASAPCPVTWHATADAAAALGDVPRGPAIVVANEFLDALPVEQCVYCGDAWHERRVGLDPDGSLRFEIGPPMKAPAVTDIGGFAPCEGGVLECALGVAELARALDMYAAQDPVAALFIDYGHERSGLGDTLQAVRAQRSVSPFSAPGETDLSHQVDFAEVARALGSGAALAIDGPVTQAAFLGSLGIAERASRLMTANPGKAADIEAAVARLMSPVGMGTRFKVIAARSRGLPPLPGFATAAISA